MHSLGTCTRSSFKIQERLTETGDENTSGPNENDCLGKSSSVPNCGIDADAKGRYHLSNVEN